MKKITKNDVKVDVYVLCYNEEALIPFMLDYWNEFATNVYVLDNYSTDNSINLLKAENRFNVEIIQHSSDNTFNDYINMQLKNNMWKNSIGKCDFVMVSDFDEVIYSKSILSELYRMKYEGCTIWRHKTYDMITKEFPIYNGKFLHEIVKTGILSDFNWGKDILFDPNKIIEMNYCAGSHNCNPVGYCKYFNDSDIYMFHFKYLSIEYVISRYKMYRDRLSNMNRMYGWGVQYDYEETRIIDEFDNMYNKKLDVLIELNK
jgi:hypothetical protein